MSHEKKNTFVWLETVEPEGGLRKSGKFQKVSPPLPLDTANVVAKLYQMEYPDMLFAVSESEPRSYRVPV